MRVWHSRIRRGIEAGRNLYEDYQRNLHFYIGEQMTRESCATDAEYQNVCKMLQGGDFLQVNRILASLASQNSALLWKNPWHKLNIRKLLAPAEDAENLRNITENSLNYVLQGPRNNWLTKARLAVLCSHFGLGFLKAVYVPDDGGDDMHREVEKKVGSVVMGGEKKDIPLFLDGPPKLNERGTPIRVGKDKYEVETRDPSDFWRTEWVNMNDMVLDPEGGNILDQETHAWICQRMVWRWDRFKSNPLFEDVAEKLKPYVRYLDDESLFNPSRHKLYDALDESDAGAFGGEAVGDQDMEPEDIDRMRLWGWQCWDIDKERVQIIIDGFPDVVSDEPYPDYMETSPYTIFKIHHIPGRMDPVTEVSQVRGLSRAYNFVQSLKYRHIQRYTRWYLAREGMFEPKELSRIMDKEDGRVVFYKDGNAPGEFTPVKDAPLSSENYILSGEIISDHDLTLGSSAERKGVSDNIPTATQAVLVDRGVSGRENDKRGIHKEGFEHHAGKMLTMMQRTPEMDNSMLVQIVGPEALLYQGTHGRAHIQGKYQVNIELEELEPADSANESREMRELAATFGPMMLESRAFTQKLFRTHRSMSEAMVNEIVEIAKRFNEAQAQGPGQDGGNKIDGTGPDQGRTSAARSIGRTRPGG